MKQIKSALILYPNQLFAAELLPDVDLIYVVEEPLFFGTDQEFPLAIHKQKLVLHRASMRRYVEEVLWQNDLDVEYVELEDIELSADILLRAQKAGAEQVYVFDPVDDRLENRLKSALGEVVETPFELRILPSPGFLLKQTEVKDYFSEKPSPSFASFYQWQRERFNILIDKKYKPVGGKWMFDYTDPQPLPAGKTSPGFESFGSNKYVQDAKNWVEKRFANNPGQIETFFWPTSHDEAKQWLQDFLKHRLAEFATYENTVDGQATLLYHSAISTMLNTGLLTPTVVVEATLAYSQKTAVNIASLEHFIRHVIGWREYLRGVYVSSDIKLPKNDGQLLLASQWWQGSTGLPPMDDIISKVNQHGYLSRTESFAVVANIMLLCGIAPSEMYKWYSGLCIDCYDWEILPIVQALYSNDYLGGIIQKPYIASSSNILQASNYSKDIWCDVWDGLFWRFVEANRTELAKNSQTKPLVAQLPRLNPDRKRIIGYRAADFIDSIS